MSDETVVVLVLLIVVIITVLIILTENVKTGYFYEAGRCGHCDWPHHIRIDDEETYIIRCCNCGKTSVHYQEPHNPENGE